MRIMQGERPSRPSPLNGCSLEPTDETWNLISRCWAHESGTRPTIAEVCNSLAAPTSAGTSRPPSEPIICALAIYNVAHVYIDTMTAPVTSTGLLAQPVLPRGGRRSGPAWWAGLTARLKTRKDRQDGGGPYDPENGNSPVSDSITSWCLLSEDSKSGGDPCSGSELDVSVDARARSFVEDVDDRSMTCTTMTSDELDSLALQAKALYACGCPYPYVGTVQAADGVQILRPPSTRMRSAL
jgi:hypothetical protein